MVCLRDPSGMSENTVVVSPAAMFLLGLCDGNNTRLDMQVEFTRRFGEIVPAEQIAELLEQMDSNLFLQGKRFEDHCRKTEEEFLALQARPSAFAGKAFPDEGPLLEEHLQAIFTGEEGGGLPDPTRKGGSLRGAIAPHIDYERGGPTYSHIYKAVGEEADAALFVILGTAHSGTERPYTATRKHFETPLGKVSTDQNAVDRLASKFRGDLFRDELAHRSEHSIEFQVIFLQYLFREREISILPILCGSFHEYVDRGGSPADDPEVADFIEALGETVKESGRKPFFIAGADLSHVGLKFGDPEPPTPESCERLEVEDRRTLQLALDGDAEGFFSAIQEEGDRRNICGLPPIYTLLKAMEAPRGKLLKYAQSSDPTLPSVVSYAGVAIY